MRNVARRIADKMVDLVAPHAAADAQACYWGSYCYCRNWVRYFNLCCDPAGYSCTCKPRPIYPCVPPL